MMIKLIAIGLLTALMLGCGHHHRHHRHTGDIALVDSSTNPGVGDITIIIHQPAPYDQTALLQELLDELREFEESQQANFDLLIEILNDTEGDCTAYIQNGKLIIAPGQLKKIPSLYHVLCEYYGLDCNPALCEEMPKPCSNEESN